MKKIYYGRAVYGKKEINAVLNVLKNDSLSLIDGKKVKTLEKKISQIFGGKTGTNLCSNFRHASAFSLLKLK